MGLAEEEVLIRDDSGLLDGEITHPKQTSWCRKLTKTLCLSVGFFVLGLCVAIPGPTLLDLGDQIQATTTNVMLLFVFRSVGYIVGSVIGGVLFDYFNKQLLLCCAFLVSSVATIAIPWCLTLVSMGTMFGLQGITMGGLDTGGNVLCLQVWGRKNGPFMQTLHFAFGIGAFIAPLLAKPFLSSDIIGNTTSVLQGNIPVSPFLKDHFPLNRSGRSDHFWQMHEAAYVFSDGFESTFEHLKNKERLKRQLPDDISTPFPPVDKKTSAVITPSIASSVSVQPLNENDTKSDMKKLDQDIPKVNNFDSSDTHQVNASASTDGLKIGLANGSKSSVSVPDKALVTSPPSQSTVQNIPPKPKSRKPSGATDRQLDDGNLDGNQIKPFLDKHKEDIEHPKLEETTPNKSKYADKEGSLNDLQGSNSDQGQVQPSVNTTGNLTSESNNAESNNSVAPESPKTILNGSATNPASGVTLQPNSSATTLSASSSSSSNSSAAANTSFTSASKSPATAVPPTKSSASAATASITKTTAKVSTTTTTTMPPPTTTSTPSPTTTTPLPTTTTTPSPTTTTLPTTTTTAPPTTTTTTSPPTKPTTILPPTTRKATSSTAQPTTNTPTPQHPPSTKAETDKDKKDHGNEGQAATESPRSKLPPPSTAIVTNGVTNAPTASVSLENSPANVSSTTESTTNVTIHSMKPSNTADSFLNTALNAVKNLSKIQFAYIIIGMALFLNSLMFFVLYCCDRKRLSDNREVDDYIVVKRVGTCFKVFLVMMLGIFFFCYVGIEVTYGALVTTFAVDFNHWPKAEGATVAAIFWGALAAGRGISIFIAGCCKPAYMLVIDMILMVAGGLVLAIGVNFYDKLLYVGTLVLGVGMSSVFPTGITWAADYFRLSGKSTAVFVVGSALGQMIVPVVTGSLFEMKDAMVLMYMTLALSVVGLMIFIIMQCCALQVGDSFVIQDRNGFLPLEDAEEDEGENMEMDLIHFDKSQTRRRKDRRGGGDSEYTTLISDLDDD